MINIELFIAISVYYFVMYVTPGPNNSILTASGINFGFRKTIPNILGIPTGHGLQLIIVCLGLGSILVRFPSILFYMKFIGSIYLLYLGYRMLGSLNVTAQQKNNKPLNFFEAVMFQFINPKAWVICITAASLFFPEKENIIKSIFFMVGMSTIINIPSISVWAYAGSIIRKYLNNNNFKKIVEWLLAAMLLLTAISIFI